MLSLLAAKHIGDILSTGLYDSLVVDSDLPMLPETLSHLGISNLCPVSGKSAPPLTIIYDTEFMSKPVVYLKEIERVGDVIETLQTTTHNFFPIISLSANLALLYPLDHLAPVRHQGRRLERRNPTENFASYASSTFSHSTFGSVQYFLVGYFPRPTGG